jgi:hypothetical protein
MLGGIPKLSGNGVPSKSINTDLIFSMFLVVLPRPLVSLTVK